jgi:alpha-tubulin suppressor-like RCC1 family protein
VRKSQVGLFVLSSMIVGVSVGSVGLAQAPRRLPIIAGNYLVNVLVEIDGTVKTWGDPYAMDRSSSLGDGVKPSRTTEVKSPRPLSGVRDIADAAVGESQVLLLTRDGTVLAWGDNDYCEVGSRDSKTTLAPVPVPGLRGAKQVAAGSFVSGAVLSDGTVWLWGSGEAGQLANGLSGWQTPCAKVPTKVEGLTGVKHLSLDEGSALALKEDGTVWGWGANSSGELCAAGNGRHSTGQDRHLVRRSATGTDSQRCLNPQIIPIERLSSAWPAGRGDPKWHILIATRTYL